LREEKEKALEELKGLLKAHSLIGLVDMLRMPTNPLQRIKKELEGEAEIRVFKKSIIRLALDELGLKELEGQLPEQPALLFSNLDCFQLYKDIARIRIPTYASGGEVAERDVLVPEGPTSLMPGPVIGELGRIGIPASVEEGRIVVKRDVVVARKGDTISPELASVLKKLGIESIDVSLRVVAFWEKGKVYPREVLELVRLYPSKLGEAANLALRLSVGIGWPTPRTIKYLLIKAHQHAKALMGKGG
jgi:large subunit ribosomal protein L10